MVPDLSGPDEELTKLIFASVADLDEAVELIKNNTYVDIIHLRLKNDWVSRLGCLIGKVLNIDSSLNCYKSHSLDALMTKFITSKNRITI